MGKLLTHFRKIIKSNDHKKGKVKYETREDFVEAMRLSGMNDKTITNIFQKFIKAEGLWNKCIDMSFVSDEMKQQYKSIIHKHLAMLSV